MTKNPHKPARANVKSSVSGVPTLEVKPPEKKEPVKSAKRGRPKKQKRATYKQVSSLEFAKLVDKMIVDLTNATVLKDKSEQMTETKLGTAVLYAMLYYFPSIDPDHPLLYLASASIEYAGAIAKGLKSQKKGAPTHG
jgi:hypothetical protein